MDRQRDSGDGNNFQNNFKNYRHSSPPPAEHVTIEHALSYLDEIKTQFAHNRNVYDQFLDIMKDFKCQAIDTPETVARLSRLFTGRPSLIMKFNLFLLDGSKVKVEGNLVTVREPNGRYTIVNGQPEIENDTNQAGSSYGN